MAQIDGQCLCGAVTVLAEASEPTLRACHCAMCRRHTSGVFISLDTGQAGMQVRGPARTYRSSDWAERGFCGTCGSTLWYATLRDGARHLAAGLFENAGGGVLALEYFSDQCPDGYGLMGDHTRLTKDETLKMFTAPEGEAS